MASETALLPAEKAEELEKELAPIVRYASNLSIVTMERAEAARNYIAEVIKPHRKKAEDFVEPIREAAYANYQLSLMKKKELLDPYDQAEKIIKTKINAFLDAEEARMRLEAEEAAAREAKLREKALKATQAAIAKLQEKGAAIEEQISGLQKLLEAPDLQDFQVQAIENEINILQARLEGHAIAMAHKVEKAEEVVLPAVAPAAPKIAGMASSKKKVVKQVVNATAVLKAVLEGKLPITVVRFDLGVMSKLANSGVQIPGVLITEERTSRVL